MPIPHRIFFLAASMAVCSTACWPLDNPIDPALCGEESCVIDGACYQKGGKSSLDSCRICDPAFGRFVWAPAAGCMITLAGNGKTGLVNGPAASAQFHDPMSIAVAAPGMVYVVESSKHVIRLVSHGKVTTFAGSGKEGKDNGPLLQARFSWPVGMAAKGPGELFLADPGNGAVRAIKSGKVRFLAGGEWGDFDGPAALAKFRNPAGVAVDSAGVVYVSDSESHVIRRIKNGQVSTLAGKKPVNGTPQYGMADGKGAQALFDSPDGLAMDGAGNLLVADSNNCLVRKVSPDGKVVTVAGQTAGCMAAKLETCADGGALTRATLAFPLALAVGLGGRVFIANENCNRIRVLYQGKVSTVAGGDDWDDADGPIAKARLYGPTGVATDSLGYVYVLDAGNFKIKVLRPKQ